MSETLIPYDDLDSMFPQEIDDITTYEDVDSEMRQHVEEYDNFIASGDLDSANALEETYPRLANMKITANDFNHTNDMIIALQRFYKDDIRNYIQTVITDEGEWLDTVSYNEWSIVTYVNENVELCYMAKVNNIPAGTLPTDTDYWIPLTLQGKQGVGTGLAPRGIWDETITYVENDMVSYNNSLWQAVVENLNSTPSQTNADWNFVVSMINEANNLIDETSGTSYVLIMSDGSPYMKEVVGNTYGTTLSAIVDEVTGTIYKLTAIKGVYYLREVGY